MRKDRLDWWGFRLESLDGYDTVPVTRIEYLLFGLILSSIFVLSWLLATAFSVVSTDMIVVYNVSLTFLIPLGIPVIFACITLTLPLRLFANTAIAGWLVMAREDGDPKYWDLIVSLSAALLFIIAFIYVENELSTSILCLSVLNIVISILFRSTPSGVLHKVKKWSYRPPDWLDIDEVFPEVGAEPIYTLIVNKDSCYKVGIEIKDEVLSTLRKINTSTGGYLYQKDAPAVVLADRAPVNGVSVDEIKLLCRQLLTAAKKHSLSSYQVANLILYFVQDVIDYELDEVSTKDFDGGPYIEYGRFAVETLNDKIGDCECTAILCASLLAYLGFEVALLRVKIIDPDTGFKSGHVAVGLKLDNSFHLDISDVDVIQNSKGVKYLYGETAIDGFNRSFGMIPPEWNGYLELNEDSVMQIHIPKNLG